MSAHVLAQELMFNGKPLMDPLSLEDCRGIQLGTDNCITVQVGHCSVLSAFGSQQHPTATSAFAHTERTLPAGQLRHAVALYRAAAWKDNCGHDHKCWALLHRCCCCCCYGAGLTASGASMIRARHSHAGLSGA